MTAVDQWIAELQASEYSLNAQNLISTVATAVAALQLLNTSAVQPFSGVSIVSAGALSWVARSQIQSSADGLLTLLNNAGNNFTRLNFGGNSAAFPALQRSGAALQAELADGSALANFLCNQLQPSTTAGILGTATNDNANAGSVGEFQEVVVTNAAPVTITTSGVNQNLTSLTLAAGDWDVTSLLSLIPQATTTTTNAILGLSTTTAVLPNAERWGVTGSAAAGIRSGVVIPPQRFSLAGSTTIFAVMDVTFAVSTMQACGYINARRVR